MWSPLTVRLASLKLVVFGMTIIKAKDLLQNSFEAERSLIWTQGAGFYKKEKVFLCRPSSIEPREIVFQSSSLFGLLGFITLFELSTFGFDQVLVGRPGRVGWCAGFGSFV